MRIVEEDATPPNWRYIMLVFLALSASSSTLTFLFPFIPEMVLSFGYSESQKGAIGGLIASSVFAGRAVGSVFWGWLTDHKGRKLVLLITVGLTGLFAFLFGFSTSLPWAMFFRFMCGLANGTVGTAKTVLADVSDNSNQAIGMTILSVAWGAGMIIGPLTGGVLASPATKWPDVFSEEGLFGQYPFLLPSIYPLIVCSLLNILIFFKFDDTYLSKLKKKVELDVPETKTDNDEEPSTKFPLETVPKPQNALARLGQSLQSVHLETESSVYLAKEALEAAERNTATSRKSHTFREKTRSEPDVSVNSDLNYPLTSDVLYFKSFPNISYENAKSSNGEVPNSGKETFMKNGGQNGYHNHLSDKTMNGHPIVRTCLTHPRGTTEVNKRNGTKESLTCLGEWKTEGTDSVLESEKPLIAGNGTRPHHDSVEDIPDKDVEEAKCGCVVWCCHWSCCRPVRNASMSRLLRLVDVWATIMLYTVFSFAAIAIEDIFPVFASTKPYYGGLGFTTAEIGVAIGGMTLPLLVIQIKLYPFLVKRLGIRKTFLLNGIVCLVCSQIFPVVRLLNENRMWQWVCLLLIQIPLKVSMHCCFAGTALLINNSVSQELIGQANGLAMTTTAIGRTMAPLLAGAVFTWTVSYGQEIGPPFDTAFPFFLFGFFYFISVLECLFMNPDLDKQKKRF